MGESKWIWYYGDFEIYHNMRLHMKRKEGNFTYPPIWRLDDCYKSVKFKKEITLAVPESFCVTASGKGFVQIGESGNRRYELGETIPLEKGSHTIYVMVANADGLPCMFAQGDTVSSDGSWLADNYTGEWTPVGYSDHYTDKEKTPEVFHFEYRKIAPKAITRHANGILYDYGRETFCKLIFSKLEKPITVYYGETGQEALDTQSCYMRDKFTPRDTGADLTARAFRYLFIVGADESEVEFSALYEYLPVEAAGSFSSSDEMMNRIWDVSAYTMELNSREFYLDGIKRDRWVWSGDAYQSYFVNRYLTFDTDIIKRTIIALRGKDPVEQHLNTILDYSFYWIMSIYDYYEMTGDKDFIAMMYPRLKGLMDFCMSRLDENGFAGKVGADWIFIDWADMDKTGAVCAEQMLFLKSLNAMASCCRVLGTDYMVYQDKAEDLLKKINEFYWCGEKGAFIDSFESGKKNVTRHANIFAVLFGYVTEEQRESIIKNVILNDVVTRIKTPYFKFFELEAMCHAGNYDYVTGQILSYWGSMLDGGATTFWEEYDTSKKPEDQLGMYGQKYAKSLCHAWGASPIYIIGRYYLGVRPTSAGYETFSVEPNLRDFSRINATVPINRGTLKITLDGNTLSVETDRDGGTLILGGKAFKLNKNEPLKTEYDIA